MSVTAESVSTAAQAPARRGALVWDAPTRVFHWLFALSFIGAYVTSESDHWRLAHITLGYTMGGLIAFRIAWGLFGTRHARFASFVRGPRSIAHYLRSLFRGKPDHHVGHNPAGAIAIVAMLALASVLVLSGLANAGIFGPEWLGHAHEAIATGMLALVGVHVAAVIVSSLLHRENLVAAMIDGRKPVAAEQGIRRPWRPVAAVMLVAVLGFWSMQWQGVPFPATTLAWHSHHSHGKHAHEHHDDD